MAMSTRKCAGSVLVSKISQEGLSQVFFFFWLKNKTQSQSKGVFLLPSQADKGQVEVEAALII